MSLRGFVHLLWCYLCSGIKHLVLQCRRVLLDSVHNGAALNSIVITPTELLSVTGQRLNLFEEHKPYLLSCAAPNISSQFTDLSIEQDVGLQSGTEYFEYLLHLL